MMVSPLPLLRGLLREFTDSNGIPAPEETSRDALERNVVAIEAIKIAPDMDTNARDGPHNSHISTQELPTDILILVLSRTTAETQMVLPPFGATLLTQRKDGTTAHQKQRKW